jgi:hypothetical protein
MPPKQATTKVGQYSLIPKFPGYHAREDPTTLPAGTLVAPSQNVLIKTSGRVAATSGYVLDGVGSTVIDSGILSNFDFVNFKGDVRNMRAGFQTAAGNDGHLQYRYLDVTNTVHWVNLMTGLTNVRLSYTTYWDNTLLVKDMLWVDGSNNIFSWNGAVTTFASATNSTGFISVLNATPTAGGTGYVVGDILAITGGTATAIVSTVASGVVTGVALVTTGSGYTAGTGNATTGGTGTGATLNITTVAANSIVTQGPLIWAQQGFNQTSGSVVIGGVNYTYTAMVGKTLVGIGTDPTVPSYAAGTIIHQAPITTPLASMTAILATFGPTVIGCGNRNQVYVGASNSNNLYISKVNSFTDYSFTTPTRVTGEGAIIPLDSPPVTFLPMENRNDTNAYDLYISEGLGTWATVRYTLSADLTTEKIEHIRMKVSPLQGAQTQRLSGMMKNHIMFVGNDNVANFLGYTSFENIPELVDFSHPIVDDMSSYDFSDGSMYYNENYIYIAVPKEGVVRIYNMTDQTKETTQSPYHAVEDVDATQPWFWEAPLTFPLSGFYWTPDKGLCGHAFATSESYELFTGGSLNGQDIDVNATFAFDDKGDRTQSKGSDELWVEGYIAQNTVLNATVAGDLDAAQTTQTVTIDGSDSSIVAFGAGAHALGKNNLGSQPLGGAQTSTVIRPAWFHVAKTYPEVPSYLEQISFYTKGIDLAWELITFGTDATFTVEGNNDITQ